MTRSFAANVLETTALSSLHAQNVTILVAFIPTRNSSVKSLGSCAPFVSNQQERIRRLSAFARLAVSEHSKAYEEPGLIKKRSCILPCMHHGVSGKRTK